MSKVFYIIFFSLIILSFVFPNFAQKEIQNKTYVEKSVLTIDQIIKRSYPEIKSKKIRVKTFKSDTNFFKARFSVSRFLTFQKMRHIIYVNPKALAFGIPENAVRGILAHELAHVLYYTEKNRLQLLGLASLASRSFTKKFERKADLVAIKRGYGKGIIEYRNWLYKNIPTKNVESKKKNYFSPAEIKLILEITKDKPEMFGVWQQNIPLNIDEIKKSIE